MTLDILNELTADNSRLAKEAILKREQNNVLLMRVLKAAYDPYISYWLVKIPEYETGKFKYSLDAAINRIGDMAKRIVTGNAAIEYFTDTLAGCKSDDAEVIERIIERDLKCGIGIPTINKIWPGLIKTFGVMLCHKDLSGIKYPAMSQVKYDGGRCVCYFDGTSVTAYSRNGKIVETCGALDESARLLMKEGEVWDGEIVFRTPGTNNFTDRKTSNGHFNRCVRGTITPDIAKDITFIAWDVIDYSSTVPYKTRYQTYVDRWDNLTEEQKHKSKIWVAESTIVKSEDEAMIHYDKCIKHGHEGTVVKNMNAVWQPKRTKDCGKCKAEEDCDLVVVGWVLGTGKYSNMLGNLVCETSDGKLRVNVGSGFSDEERAQPPEYFLDKIVTVRYNQLIKSKDEAKAWTLFLPRFVCLRDFADKSIPNNFEELK